MLLFVLLIFYLDPICIIFIYFSLNLHLRNIWLVIINGILTLLELATRLLEYKRFFLKERHRILLIQKHIVISVLLIGLVFASCSYCKNNVFEKQSDWKTIFFLLALLLEYLRNISPYIFWEKTLRQNHQSINFSATSWVTIRLFYDLTWLDIILVKITISFDITFSI